MDRGVINPLAVVTELVDVAPCGGSSEKSQREGSSPSYNGLNLGKYALQN